MGISNAQVLAMIYAGANITLDPRKFSALQRESQVIAAGKYKVNVTYIRANVLDHQERVFLSHIAPGLVHFDCIEA